MVCIYQNGIVYGRYFTELSTCALPSTVLEDGKYLSISVHILPDAVKDKSVICASSK